MVRAHETDNTMVYDITGLSDYEDFMFCATNPTDTAVLLKDDADYSASFYYYTTDGILVNPNTDTIPAYGAKGYFRTIAEGIPTLSYVGISGTIEVSETATAIDPDLFFTHSKVTRQEHIPTVGIYRLTIQSKGECSRQAKPLSTYTIGAFAGSYLILGVVPVAAAGTGTLLTGVERFSVPALIGA